MSIHFSFRGALIVISVHGVLTYAEVTRVFDKIAAHPMFKPPAKILFDARHTDYGPSSEELESLALHLAGIEAFQDSRLGFLAQPHSMVFGLARMYCNYAEFNGLTAEPFSDFLQAAAWLLRSKELYLV